jgi:hypothetical protein
MIQSSFPSNRIRSKSAENREYSFWRNSLSCNRIEGFEMIDERSSNGSEEIVFGSSSCKCDDKTQFHIHRVHLPQLKIQIDQWHSELPNLVQFGEKDFLKFSMVQFTKKKNRSEKGNILTNSKTQTVTNLRNCSKWISLIICFKMKSVEYGIIYLKITNSRWKKWSNKWWAMITSFANCKCEISFIDISW